MNLSTATITPLQLPQLLLLIADTTTSADHIIRSSNIIALCAHVYDASI